MIDISKVPSSDPAGSPPSGPSGSPSGNQATDLARNLDQWFMIFWIALAIGVPTLFIIIGFGGLIVSLVFSCIILYHLWSLIPADKAKTTPGKAVGFLFIPFFNFYWNFVAIHGLAQSLNAEANERHIASTPINEKLSLAFCVVAIASAVLLEMPIASMLLSIAQMVMFIVLLWQMKEVGKRLIFARQQP